MKTVKQLEQAIHQLADKPLKSTKKAVNSNDQGQARSSATLSIVPHPSDMMQERFRQIQEVAYYKAEQRGFAPGHELEDWLAAEAEVDKASRPLESY